MKMTKKWPIMFAVLLVVALVAAGCGKKEQTEQAATPAPPPTSAPTSQPVPEVKSKQWDQAPTMQIDPNKKYSAEVDTSKGKFTIELFAKEAPKTVNNFVFLAKEGYYNDVTFHRIIETFMIQTGDPTATGAGGPGYTFEDELPPPMSYEAGVVAMANAGPNTNGSQFFINTVDNTKNLKPHFTVFGKVVEGMDTVQAIAKTPVKVNPNSRDSLPSMPTEKVTINSIKIVEK